MKPERYLQVFLAATAALATVLLGLGEGNWILPVIAIFAAITSVLFTDIWQWFWFNRHVANVCALGAVGFTVIDYLGVDPSERLLSIANLLIYLQIVLFYQRKNDRVYWQILVLSLLQVVVSAALNLGVEFGLLLVLYMFLALVSLALLFVYRESLVATETTADQRATTGTDDESKPRQAFWTQRAARPDFTEVAPARDPSEMMFNGAMVYQIIRLGVLTIGLTFLVFFMTPRYGKSAWTAPTTIRTEDVVG
ncbi:MAG: hypothetical protein KDA60_16575, partial [Planctomycetales bacterium]|nr:hypothetical protein [Planctomycetales bacterium]